MLLANLYQSLVDSSEFLNAQYHFELTVQEKIHAECPQHKDSREEYTQCVTKYNNYLSEYTNLFQLMVEQRQDTMLAHLEGECLKRSSVEEVRRCMRTESQQFAKRVGEKDLPFLVQLRKLMMQRLQ